MFVHLTQLWESHGISLWNLGEEMKTTQMRKARVVNEDRERQAIEKAACNRFLSISLTDESEETHI